MSSTTETIQTPDISPKKLPIYRSLYIQVLTAVVLGILLVVRGYT